MLCLWSWWLCWYGGGWPWEALLLKALGRWSCCWMCICSCWYFCTLWRCCCPVKGAMRAPRVENTKQTSHCMGFKFSSPKAFSSVRITWTNTASNSTQRKNGWFLNPDFRLNFPNWLKQLDRLNILFIMRELKARVWCWRLLLVFNWNISLPNFPAIIVFRCENRHSFS